MRAAGICKRVVEDRDKWRSRKSRRPPIVGKVKEKRRRYLIVHIIIPTKNSPYLKNDHKKNKTTKIIFV